MDPALKKPLPKHPKTIGVVTSPTGSVIQDIIHVLKRRFPNFHLILNPVRVQGAEASKEIAQAIETFNAHSMVDVMIVGRGGGSLEDLWPFNEECVAQAIFESKIPVISAVGHETDVTLADCVADVRAPTPSAAAEISVKEQSAQVEFLRKTTQSIDQIIKQKKAHLQALLKSLASHPLLSSPFAILGEHFQRIDDFSKDLDTSMRHKIQGLSLQLAALKREHQVRNPQERLIQSKKELLQYSEGISQAMSRLLTRKKEHLSQLSTHIDAVNPENILKKGYCIPFAEKENSVMMLSRDAFPGLEMHLRFHDGTVRTRVEEVNGKQQ
jgi:exodeoxyribonuclease VII large subunit